MNGYLRQSTAAQVRTIGPFVDDTDFKTLENGLTIANTDILLKKNGGASAAKNSGGATADGAGGLYAVTWDATDTATVGELYCSVKVAGALVVFGSYVVLEEEVYDDMFAAAAVGYLKPVTAGRDLVVDAAGLADANAVKVGPTGSGTAQTAVDIPARLGAPAGASVSADIAAAKVDTAAIKVQTDKLTFTVANQVDSNVLDWKSSAAPAMTGDAFARLGAPAGASVSADVAAVKVDTAATLAAVDTEVAAILAAVDTEVASILALLNSARTEPAQGAPPVNPNMATKVDYLYKSWRNKKDNDGTTTKLYADDATTVDHKQATSEAAGTVTKGEWATGP